MEAVNFKNELKKIKNGAIFRRADLHIHSYDENREKDDVMDVDLTPENIIDISIKENLEVISITDHNSISNLERAIEYSKDKNILFIPGVEINSAQGHLLLYFSSLDEIKRFLGKLNFSKDYSICHNGIVDCLKFANDFNGIGIAAHIDGNANFERISNLEFKKEIVLTHNLLGIEINNPENINWFSEDDEDSSRKELFRIRKKGLNKQPNYVWSRVLSSDAHSLKNLGINAKGNKKLTRLKLDKLDFNSFRVALLDPESRIRIEEFIPNNIPYISGILVEGGFLDGSKISFSKNLNCIIGGRGTGKSTLLESIRSACGAKTTKTDLVDSDVWPDKISLLTRDEVGREQIMIKEKYEELINASDTEDGILKIPIESYGQGDTAERIKNCDKDPKILLNFLDDFIELNKFRIEERDICQKLEDNCKSIMLLKREVDKIPEISRLSKSVDDSVAILREQKAGSIVRYEENLIRGRDLRKNLINDLKDLFESIKNALTDKDIFNKVFELDYENLLIGKEEFLKINRILKEFSTDLDNIYKEVNIKTKDTIEKLNKSLKEWSKKEVELLNKIEKKRNELANKGIKLDLSFIKKVTSESLEYKKYLSELNKKRELLVGKTSERNELLNKREEIKKQIFNERYRWFIKINNLLKSTITGYEIKMKLGKGLLSKDLQDFIKEKMGWRTSRVPKAKIISENYTVFDFLKGIKAKNLNFLQDLKDDKNDRLLTDDEINEMLNIFSEMSNLFQLQSLDFEDLPEIIVTKFDKDESGNINILKKKFENLSLGQQQSVLLSILLHSDSKNPLVIDQPEDNLDSEFVYNTIVNNLRKIKEKRQIILVTHNSNIAVLGDSELIIPLKSTSNKASIVYRGSIDNKDTKKITCGVLEGSAEAFKRRRDIYGID